MFHYDQDKNYKETFRDYWNDNVRQYKRNNWIAAVLMIVLGVLCFIYPVRSILAMEIIASILLIVIGVAEIVSYARAPIFFRVGGRILSGILNIIVGLLLLFSPAETMITTFAFIFAISLMTLGIEFIAMHNRAKFFGEENAGWLMFSGIVNIIFAVILMLMPNLSIAFSYVVAIYLIMGGITAIVNAVSARKLNI